MELDDINTVLIDLRYARGQLGRIGEALSGLRPASSSQVADANQRADDALERIEERLLQLLGLEFVGQPLCQSCQGRGCSSCGR